MMVSTYIALSIILHAVHIVNSEYKTYFVEDWCIYGSEKNTYHLPSTQESSSIILSASRIAPYGFAKNCTVKIQPSEGGAEHGIIISIREIDFYYGSLSGCVDYIQIYDSSTFDSLPLCRFKMDFEEDLTYSTSGVMKLLYHTRTRSYRIYSSETGFKVIATRYSNKPCSSDEYECDNSKCIWIGLKCDGHNNCGDNSDEKFDLCDFGVRSGILQNKIIFIGCGAMFGIIVLTTILFFCLRNKVRVRTTIPAIYPDDNPPILSPYQAIHPAGYNISENPAGPNRLYSMHQDGFSNPCYPSGIPQAPPPYKP